MEDHRYDPDRRPSKVGQTFPLDGLVQLKTTHRLTYQSVQTFPTAKDALLHLAAQAENEGR